MNDLFADTSGWGNLVDPRQTYHSLARGIYEAARQQGRKLVTTNYVITELVALMTSPLRVPRSKTIEFIDSIKSSPYVDAIHIDARIDAEAWELLSSRSDKQWSLVDCSSFIVMRNRRMTDALTTDHNFEQAGFTRLLK